MPKRFVCVTISPFYPLRRTERVANTAAEAAETSAEAINNAYWPEYYANGVDIHGAYSEFTIKETRMHCVVRIYEEYTP